MTEVVSLQLVVTRLQAGYLRFESGQGQKFLLFATTSRPPVGPIQPPNQLVMGDFSLGLNWPGCIADHLSLSSTKVKNLWSYTSTPSYIFMVWCLVKYRIRFHGI